MSEKIFARLLRLYPRHFRETYGDEALQLFRDRSGNERGLFSRLQLWLDLLIDLFTSVPREYRRFTPKLATASSQQPLRDEHPAFGVLDRSSLSLRQVFAGGLLSLLSFLMILFSVSYGARNHSLNASSSQMQSLDFWQSLMPRELSPQASSDDSDVIVLGKQPFGAPIRTKIKMVKPNTSQWNLLTLRIRSEPFRSGTLGNPADQAFWTWLSAFNSGDPKTLETYIRTVDPADTVNSELRFRRLTGGFHIQEIVSNKPQFIRVLLRERNSWTRFLGSMRVADGGSPRVVSFGLSQIPRGSDIEETRVDSAEKRHVIDAVIADLKQYYVYPEVAQEMADSLLTHEKQGDDGFGDGRDSLRRSLNPANEEHQPRPAFAAELPPLRTR